MEVAHRHGGPRSFSRVQHCLGSHKYIGNLVGGISLGREVRSGFTANQELQAGLRVLYGASTP